MYRKVFFFGTFSLLVIIGVASLVCGSNDPGNEILGVWNLKEFTVGGKIDSKIPPELKGTTVEFFSDKTYLMKHPTSEGSGSWVILNDGRIKMTGVLGNVFFGTNIGHELIMVIGNEKLTFQKLK